MDNKLCLFAAVRIHKRTSLIELYVPDLQMSFYGRSFPETKARCMSHVQVLLDAGIHIRPTATNADASAFCNVANGDFSTGVVITQSYRGGF